MSTLRNRVQLIGHLGQDPEIKTLDSGRKLAKFTMATNDSFVNKEGERIENTEWHNIVAWGKTAEIVEKFLNKGREVMIVGKITYRQYETDKGEKRYFTEIVADELLMLGKA